MIGGQKIEVHVVRGTHSKLEGCNGIYLPIENRIYLARELERTALEDTLFHEFDHVVNDVGGVNQILASVVPKRKLDDVEESIVRCRTPIWHRLLKDLGFQFPKGPYE